MMLHLIFQVRELTKLNSFFLSLPQFLTFSFMYLNLLEFNLHFYTLNMFLFIAFNMLHSAGSFLSTLLYNFWYFLPNLLSFRCS